jgi:hypothetical protein
MDDLHRRLLEVGYNAGNDLGLMLAGGYALAAHGLLDRRSQDVDFATSTPLPLPTVVDRLASAYRALGYIVEVLEGSQRMARLLVNVDGAVCEVDILKEAIGPPAQSPLGPVVAFDDAVGLKMRALHGRSAHRDFIDVRAAHSQLSWPELERLGARHTQDFSLEELADRLGAVEDLDEDDFAGYGLDGPEIAALQSWALAWESDIRARLAAGEDGPVSTGHDEWDAYIDSH